MRYARSVSETRLGFIPSSLFGGARGGLDHLCERSETKREEERKGKGKIRFPLESRLRIYVIAFTLNFNTLENRYHLGAGGQL